MRVDFYQIGGTPLERLVSSLAGKLLEEKERCLLVADDEAMLARLDRMLWDEAPTSFCPHGIAGGADDARQPLLLSTTTVAANRARNIIIADGKWREAALDFERAFHLFDSSTLEDARLAWKLLSGRDGVERHYWAQDEQGKWGRKG